MRQNKYGRTWRCALEAGRCAAEGRKRREASPLLYFSRRSQCSCPICPRMAMFSWTTAPKVALFLGYPAPAVCFPFSNGAKLLPRVAFPTGKRSIHPQCLAIKFSCLAHLVRNSIKSALIFFKGSLPHCPADAFIESIRVQPSLRFLQTAQVQAFRKAIAHFQSAFLALAQRRPA